MSPAAGLLLCLLALFFQGESAAAAGAPVTVFPIPGSRVAPPGAQIVFRGVPVSQLGQITVTGSGSGVHNGTVIEDSDGQGGSFVPAKSFNPGETVTVTTSLSILGGTGGTFHFQVANPAPGIPFRPLPYAMRTPHSVRQFRSAPGLLPAAVTLSKRAPGGDFFVASEVGPAQDGPEIIGPNGNLVWFHPIPHNDAATSFSVGRYLAQPVLTWWQGNVNLGSGRGEDLIYDAHYQPVAVVRAADGLSADLHEFQITPQNTALITAYYPVYWNTSAAGGGPHRSTIDSVIQEIDIRTGLLLFQWDSLDHVPVTASFLSGHARSYDYFHVNSIDVAGDGNLVISARNAWAAYKINRHTGAIIWHLGGKHSSFALGPHASFAFQHDVRVHTLRHHVYVTMFDDGAGPPNVEKQSRGLMLALNFKAKTAKVVAQQDHSPPLLSTFEGNYQALPNGDAFIGWGQRPYFSEFGGRGRMVLDGHFVADTDTYRAFRFAWSGRPAQLPAVAALNRGKHTVVYASWNGATGVASWRVLGGSSASSLQPGATLGTHRFETRISVRKRAYVAVQALAAGGQVLGQSATVAPR